MANQQLTVPDDQDLFLEFLLRCALTAPGAASSPTAGRILARLLVVGAIEGGDRLVTPYLVPVPGEDAVFEVRAYHPGNLEPTEVRSGLGAAAALRIALRAARDGDDGIEVVSQAESGLERCVLVRDSTGDFEFRFASGETLTGHPADCAAARREWTSTLARWRAWVAEEHPKPSGTRALIDRPTPSSRRAAKPEQLGPAPAASPEPVVEDEVGPVNEDIRWRAVDPIGEVRADPVPPRDVDVLAGQPRPPTALRGWWVPHREDDDEPEIGEEGAVGDDGEAEAEGAPWDDGTEVEPVGADDAGEDHVGDEGPYTRLDLEDDLAESVPLYRAVDDEPDWRPAPRAPAATLTSAASSASDASDASAAAAPPTLSPAPADVAPLPTFDVAAVIGAIQDGLANLTVKPDLSQVEELLARAMTGDRDLVEPLARRLSSRLGESLGRHDTRDFIDALLPLIPRPGEVAEAVTADVTALLSEVMLRRRPGEFSGGLEGQGIIGAIEQLQVQVDGLRDQLRKSTGVIESVDERMEVSDRRAVAAERIGASIEQEMQRLALRIDEQVSALAANAGSGSELADGVARLTRKLRQSVVQLDRALVRLDEVVDHPAVRPAVGPAVRSGVRPGVNVPLADEAERPPVGPARRSGMRPGYIGRSADDAPPSPPARPGRR